ncbi:MAG: translocation/assembly module TamB domain-containing protein [Myxococcaceae bacterium]
MLCVGGTVWFLRTQYAWDKACELARTKLPDALNADVQIGACEIDPLTQSVIAKDIVVRPREAPKDAPPLLSAERAEVALAGIHPFFRTVELNRVAAQKPKVVIDLRNPKPKTGDGAKCSLDPARRVEIDQLALKDASVTLLLPDDKRVEVSRLDVRWTLRRGVAEFEIEAKDGLVHLGGKAQDLALTRLVLQGNFSADDEQIEFSRAEVGIDDVTVNWTGRVEELCDPNLSLEAQLFLPLRSLSKVVSLPQPTEGHIWSRLSLSGKIAEPIASLEVAGSDVKIDKFVPGDFRAQLSYAGRNVTVNSLSVPVGSGVVKASGAVQLIPGLPLQAKADIEGVSLAHVLERVGLTGAWVDFLAAGHGQITGKLHPLELAGEADIKAQKFLLATRPYDAPPKSGKDLLAFPAAHVTTNLRVLPDRVELSGIEASTPKTSLHADVTLHYEQARGLSIKGSSEQMDLSDFGQIAGIHMAGKGSASFEVEGPYSDVKVGALVNMRDFDFWDFSLGVVQGRLEYADKVLSFPGLSGQKGRTPFSGSGALAFGDKKKGMHATGHVTAKGRVEDLIDLIAPMNDSISIFQGTLAGEVTSAKVDIDCPVEKLAGNIALDVAKMTYYDRPVGDGHLQLTLFDGQGIRLEPTTLKGALGTTHADGTFLFEGPLDYRFKLENYSLAEVVGREQATKGGIAGTLTMVGKVEGDSTTPVVSAYLTSPKIEIGEKNVGAMHLEGRIQGKDLQVWGKPFDDARLFSKMRLKEPFPYQGQLTLSLPEIKPLLPATAVAQGLSGALSGTFTARGSINEEDSLDASAQIDKLTLSRADFSGQNDGPIILTYNHGKLDVDAFSFKGPNTELSAAGWAGPTNMDMKLRGTFDMRLVESFTSYFERTGGKVELTAAATGSMKAPSIVGSALVQDARLTVRDQAINVRGVNGKIDFSEARVLVQDLYGVVNNGRVTVHGDIRLDKFKLKEAQVGVELDEVAFSPKEYLPITTTGELLLYGRPDSLTLTGGLHLVKLRYDQQLDLQSVLAEARKGPSIGGTTLEKPKEWLHLNVDIFADGDVRVDNDLARARLTTGSGKLTLTGTNLHPGLVGTIETAEGSEAFYRNNRFQITQGLLEFKDKRNIDPNFELRAETQVREFLVKLHAFGRPASPNIILSSEPALSEADILSLLTLGVISRDRGTGAAGAGAGLAAEAFFTASGLGQQVQRFLPKNQVFRDMSFHLSTTYNDATGLVEPTAQLESKFLTEQLKLNMTQPVSGRGTHAAAEYRFDNRLSAQAQWDNEVSDYSFGNLGLELKLRWEVE